MEFGQPPVEGLDMMPAADFWCGKRVFLTGHTGFKGSWLALWLQHFGADVIGYALAPPTRPSLFEVAHVGAGMRSIIADIRDPESVTGAVRESRPDVVIHMAAQALVRHSYIAPVETYATNVMGTVHLLEAIRAVDSVRAVVVVTSDKCYENREWPWGYREIDPMGGHDPYSSSKGCAELVTAAYRDSFLAERNVAVASVRAGNVIGGGDWATDRLVPDILRAIEHGQPVNIRSPHAVRPWQHVLEPLSGYLQLAQKLYIDGAEYAEGWNFGSVDEDTRPVQYIVERLTGLWGEGATWQLDGNPHPREAHYLKLDCSKARSRLRWQPVWGLDKALASIVTWHKACRNGADLKAVTLQQLDDYMKGSNACKP